MNVLVTVSENYCGYMLTMLKSLFQHNKCRVTVYLMHSRISDAMLEKVRQYIEGKGHVFEPVRVGADMFDDAPVNMHFTKEMYCWRAACFPKAKTACCILTRIS